MKNFALFFTLLMSLGLKAQEHMVNTYSIVAQDPASGQMGGAVQSHYFSVPGTVLYAEAGVGVVATQALVNPVFGPEGLRMLASGKTAEETVQQLVLNDEGAMYRQLGIVDVSGNVAQHTGKNAIPSYCMLTGKGYAVQANMMLKDGVCQAMANAFEKARKSKQPFKQQLMDALVAAQNAGGDIRGMQSAGMVIVSAKKNSNPMLAKPLELQVEDHPQPLKELQRLLNIHSAYDYMNQGDVAMEKGATEKALALYGKAQDMYPENKEFIYWSAISLANVGRVDEAKEMLAPVFKADPNWIQLTYNLLPTGLLQLSEAQVDTLVGKGE